MLTMGETNVGMLVSCCGWRLNSRLPITQLLHLNHQANLIYNIIYCLFVCQLGIRLRNFDSVKFAREINDWPLQVDMGVPY
jgi:hypothetical protein